MDHLEFFVLTMTDLRERGAAREIRQRQSRIGDAPSRIRDNAWAAAIHRWVTAEHETPAPTATPTSLPDNAYPRAVRMDQTPTPSAARAAEARGATLGCASA
jgi:hypothetical protein